MATAAHLALALKHRNQRSFPQFARDHRRASDGHAHALQAPRMRMLHRRGKNDVIHGRVRRWRGARRPVSTPCPPNRTCGSPASGSPVGSCNSHTERQFGAASSHRRSPAVPVALRAPGSEAARLHRGAPLRRAARPVHALTAPSLPSVSPAPSLTHVMLRNSLPLHAGFIGKATPAGLRPSVIPPHLRPLSSTGITPRLQSYGPLRHPAGPACPSRGSGCRVHGTDGASRVATHSIFHTCRRHYPGGNQPVVPSLSSRPVGGLPLSCGGSAPAFDVSRPAQRSLTFRPAWSLGLLPT